jgi:DNA-binding beta-propeller fold protein YncE
LYFPAPVSIAIASGNTAYVANYLDILVLDLVTGIGSVLSRPPGIDIWMPAAVAYDAHNRRLYVANYKGHDVLVLELVSSAEPVLVHRFVDPKMQGPEGVAVSADGKTIAVADYDASAVHIFSSNGALQSSTPVGLAHGVTMSLDGNTVIATGLSPPAIYRIGLDGSVLQVYMHSGWHANEYIYPTAITTTEGGFLAVTDAHSGRISLLSSQLTEVTSAGTNGTNFTQFYLPYGIAPLQQSQLFVADTRKDRLIQLDIMAGTLVHVWRFHGLSGDAWRSRLLRPQGLQGLVAPVGSFDELFIAEKLAQPDIMLEHYTLPPGLLVSTASPGLSEGFQDINTGDLYRLTLPDPEQTLPSLWHRTRIEFVADSHKTLSRASLFPLFTMDWMYFPYVVNLTPEGSCTVIGSSAMPEVIVLIRGTAFPIRRVRSRPKLEETLQPGYVKRCHEERAAPAPRVVGPDSASPPSRHLDHGGGVRAAHCRSGGRSRGVEGRDSGTAGTPRSELAELLAASVVGRAAGQA